jgi:hypothetical protein
MSRPIEHALEAERPAKATVRALWLREVRRYEATNHERPLYLTLPGALGKDIEMLVDAAVLTRTETGAISEPDRHKVVAIESNSDAIYSLQQRFPGLAIREQNLMEIIGGSSSYSWPNQERRADFCARVVNLDLDRSLQALVNGQDISFPLIKAIKKISQLHHEPQAGQKLPWSLCVTVNGSMNWQPEVFGYLVAFLASNCTHHPDFSEKLSAILGGDLVATMIRDRADVPKESFSAEQLQILACIFLAKQIVESTNEHAWQLAQSECLIYGGEAGHAPMVTLILTLEAAEPELGRPARRYDFNLSKLLPSLGKVDMRGNVVPYLA